MGMRCMTGEKSQTWHIVANLLNLPHPADAEVVEYLGGDDLREWFRLASIVKAYFHQMTGYPVMMLDELDEDGKIFDDVQARPLVYATFMRLSGLMQADEARWREEYERKHPVGIDDDDAWEEREAEMNEKYRFVWA